MPKQRNAGVDTGMQKIAYLFPGQGAQYVGMGKGFYDSCPASRDVFDEAENVLPRLNIKRLCFEGPIEELTRTINSQVCILVVSIAALEALGSRLPSTPLGTGKTPLDFVWGGQGSRTNVAACAGLSLGELTALVAAKSIEFSDAVRLVRRRGELMEEASAKNPGSMASIIGISLEDLKGLCNKSGAEIANLNCPGQIVISGARESVKTCMKLALKNGAKKAMPLNVSGPFHSSLMKEAAGLFKIELDKVRFSAPEIGVVSNVTADYVKTPEGIRANLERQLHNPVLWEESVRKIAGHGVESFLEIGPGKVLKGLLRRIEPALKVYNIEKMEDVNSFASQTGWTVNATFRRG